MMTCVESVPSGSLLDAPTMPGGEEPSSFMSQTSSANAVQVPCSESPQTSNDPRIIDSEQTFDIRLLPEEVLSQILSYGTIHETMCVNRLVCRKWFDLCGDRDVWKDKVFICDDDTKTKQLINMLRYSFLTDVAVINTVSQSLLTEALEYGQHLKYLTVAVPTFELEILQRIGRNCVGLQVLDLESNSGDVTVGPDDVKGLQNLLKLKRIDLYNFLVEENAMIDLVENWTELEHLVYCGTPLGDNFIKKLVNSNPNLKTLEIQLSSTCTEAGLSLISELHSLDLFVIEIFTASPAGQVSFQSIKTITEGCHAVDWIAMTDLDEECFRLFGYSLKGVIDIMFRGSGSSDANATPNPLVKDCKKLHRRYVQEHPNVSYDGGTYSLRPYYRSGEQGSNCNWRSSVVTNEVFHRSSGMCTSKMDDLLIKCNGQG